SVILHGFAALAVAWLSVSSAPSRQPWVRRAPAYVLTFLHAPEVPLPAPVTRPLVAPPPPKPDASPPELVRIPDPEPMAKLEPRPIRPSAGPLPIPPKPAHTEPVKPANFDNPAKPAHTVSAPPPVAVGGFETATNRAQNPTPGRQVAETGFDTTPARAPEMKLPGSTTTGGFDRAASSGAARPGTDRPIGSGAQSGVGWS